MKLIIIDGYGFVFRAFHSLPPLTRADGTPIGTVYGFTAMLLKFIEQHNADYIVVALDTGKKTFRSDIYPEYKAHRPPAPPELIMQFPIIREAVTSFGIKILEQDGVEADDLIASYAKYALEQELEVMIVSGDKDLMQLIQPGISLYDPMRNKHIQAAEVKEKFGVEPSQVLDYLSLVGDASDNIPGVAGIGAKTASSLLVEYHSLNEIYEKIDTIQPQRRRQLLLEGREQAFISQQLVALKHDIIPQYTIEDLCMPNLHDGILLTFLTQQGFKHLAAKLMKQIQVPVVLEVAQDNIKITQLAELIQLKSKILREPFLAIYYDQENFYLECAGIQYVMTLNNEASNLFSSSPTITLQQCLTTLCDVIAEPGVRKVCYDSKNIFKRFLSMGISPKNIEDIATMAYCLETGRSEYILEAVLDFAGIQQPICKDARNILKAYHALQKKIVQEKLSSLYTTIDQPLNLILAKMENHGVKIDAPYLAKLSSEFKEKSAEIAEDIYREAGCEFNIASPKQIGEILFVKMGISGGKRSKKGAFSTGVDILEELDAEGFAIAGKILEWRKFSKLISTYTESLPKFINPKTGRVHSSFNATLTSTGRLSSQDPNLQNIPIRSVEGSKIRQAFIASPGHILLSADYSQIELRLLAHVADVPSLKTAFLNGKDIHTITASQIFGLDEEQVDANLRRKAKAINFGIIYGISPFGLARNIGVSIDVAKNYIDSYLSQYPGIKQYMDDTISFAKQHGYVNTIFGRRCLVPNINSSNYVIRNFAERAAINAPLQGSNADIIKKAMSRLAELQQYLILQIHDELLFEIPQNQVGELEYKIKQIMEGVAAISVPLPVEIKFGKSWAEAH